MLSLSRLHCLAVGLCLAVSTASPASARVGTVDRMPDPFALYGREIVFDVMREGKRVGEHRVAFRRDGRDLAVDASFEVGIGFLGVVFYRYRYESREVWRDGKLQQVRAAVNDDGEKMKIFAARIGDRLVVDGPDGRYAVREPVFPTNHWNPAVLGSDAVLNTLTGNMNRVDIRPVERTTVETDSGPRQAVRYRYTGQLQTDAWYDLDGRWVKLRFTDRSGATVEYRCRQCGPAEE